MVSRQRRARCERQLRRQRRARRPVVVRRVQERRRESSACSIFDALCNAIRAAPCSWRSRARIARRKRRVRQYRDVLRYRRVRPSVFDGPASRSASDSTPRRGALSTWASSRVITPFAFVAPTRFRRTEAEPVFPGSNLCHHGAQRRRLAAFRRACEQPRSRRARDDRSKISAADGARARSDDGPCSN